MKTTEKQFKAAINKFLGEGVDRVRRRKRGYTDDVSGDDYSDVSEEFEFEDVDRVRRHNDEYGDDYEESMDMSSYENGEEHQKRHEEDNNMFSQPMGDKIKKKGKGHAVPSEIELGDTAGGPPGQFAATVGAAYDPLSDEDPKQKGDTFRGWGNGEEVEGHEGDEDEEKDHQMMMIDLPKLLSLSEEAPSEEAEAWISQNVGKYQERYGEKHGRERVYKDAQKKFQKKKSE